jgi:putative inorganic carbon (hco3(-)) transporter
MLFKLFLFFCLFLPLQIALNPGGSFDLASGRVFVLLLFFLWLAESLKNKKLVVTAKIQSFFILSFLFLNALSLSVAENKEWSVRKLVFLLSLFPIYFVSASLIKNKVRLILCLKWLVWGGLGMALLGIIQFFAQFIFGREKVYQFWAVNLLPIFLGHNFSGAVLQNPSWLVNISGKTYLRATAVFPDPHMLAFFLGITAALAVGIFFNEKRKFFPGVAIIIILSGALLTFSRGGYVGILAALLLGITFLRNKLHKKAKRAFLIGLILGGLLLLPGPIFNRYSSIFNLQEGSNAGRIEIWQKTLVIIERHPLLGVGLGNYSLEIKPTASYREPFNAHNTYLDIAAETGILNLLLWLGLLGFSLASFLKKASGQIIFLGPALAIVVFAVHSFFETALYSPVILPLLLIVLSCINLKPDEWEQN